MNRTSLLLVITISFVQIRTSGQIYVKQGATGANNGTSWTNAYTSLGTALNAATQGAEVWVAAGNYTAPANSSFFLKEGVAAYGGFTGSETMLSQRNPSANEVVLHGNGRNVVRTQFTVTSATILDGFTITGGDVPYNTSANYGGGGIRAEGSPQLRNLYVRSNTSYSVGGGIYLQKSTSSITNVTVSLNMANAYGGGIYCEESAPTFSCVEVTGNGATSGGGGIYHRNDFFNGSGFSSGAVYNSTINANSTGQGGGVYSKNCRTIYVNCRISQNTASSDGGGIYQAGPWGYPDLYFNVLISDNTAATGGGIYADDADISFVNMTLTNNYSNSSSSGGMFCQSSDLNLKNSIIYGNRVTPSAPMVNNVAKDQFSYATYYNCLVQDFDASGLHGRPHFADSANANYLLTSSSDAINAGSNSQYTISVNTDLAGSQRIYGQDIDIGAFEYIGAPAALPEHAEAGIFLYPQPAEDLLYTGCDKACSFSISDLQGRTLLRGNNHDPRTGIDISTLPEGTYLLRATVSEKIRSGRFVKVATR